MSPISASTFMANIFRSDENRTMGTRCRSLCYAGYFALVERLHFCRQLSACHRFQHQPLWQISLDRTKTEQWALAAAAFVMLVILPSLNVFTSAGSFLHVTDFSINLYGKYL